MTSGDTRIPIKVQEYWVFPKLDDERDIRKWLLEEKLFDRNELDRLQRANLTNDHLNLLIANKEDPAAISLIYAMSNKQLDRFRKYVPSDAGQLYLGLLNARWMADNALTERFDMEKCNEMEKKRDYLFTRRARVYWVIENRYNSEMFREEEEDSLAEKVEEIEGERVLALSA